MSEEPEPLDADRAARKAYLRRLWAMTKGSPDLIVDRGEVGQQLGFDEPLIDRVSQQLAKEGALEFVAIGGRIAITPSGTATVERALSAPMTAPSYKSVHVENLDPPAPAPISHRSPPSMTMAGLDVIGLLEVLSKVQNKLPSMGLTAADERQVIVDIATIELQMQAPRPRLSFVKEAGASLRTALEQAPGSAARELLDAEWPRIAHLFE